MVISLRPFLLSVLALSNANPTTASTSHSTACTVADDVSPPNIVFVLLDDLGWGDLSISSGQFPTPNMDDLISTGVRLNRHYVHLMCSPSRTQFLTGRYAMNLGFGEFFPWDDSEMGGIPLGQPTIANWLSSFAGYSTYYVGKWHLGYANPSLLPLAKGFDHFFGFYQGAIDYDTKTYNDIEYGDIGAYDFFEDGAAAYDAVASPKNTMTLYADKLRVYLETEAAKSTADPFFLIAALQSMHVPFPDLPDYELRCDAMTADKGFTALSTQRRRYCALLLLTDEVVGDIVTSLKDNSFWDNTLLIFTTDNGGETARGASNYPFRGTKGEPFEGNTRVVTAIHGGIIENAGLSDSDRDAIISNLDWTPTLLDFAGYLHCITPTDFSWDGQSQRAMIMAEANAVNTEREHLVLNIGDETGSSASMLTTVDGRLFKYISTAQGSAADQWVYSGNLADVWSEIDSLTGELRIAEFVEGASVNQFSQNVDGAFVFDLTNDPQERVNLLSSGEETSVVNTVIAQCEAEIARFVSEEALFTRPLDMLHTRLNKGDPALVGDGTFVRPFLSDREYRTLVNKMFAREEKTGHAHSEELKELYLTEWVCPAPRDVKARGVGGGVHLKSHMAASQPREVKHVSAVLDGHIEMLDELPQKGAASQLPDVNPYKNGAVEEIESDKESESALPATNPYKNGDVQGVTVRVGQTEEKEDKEAMSIPEAKNGEVNDLPPTNPFKNGEQEKEVEDEKEETEKELPATNPFKNGDAEDEQKEKEKELPATNPYKSAPEPEDEPVTAKQAPGSNKPEDQAPAQESAAAELPATNPYKNGESEQKEETGNELPPVNPYKNGDDASEQKSEQQSQTEAEAEKELPAMNPYKNGENAQEEEEAEEEQTLELPATNPYKNKEEQQQDEDVDEWPQLGDSDGMADESDHENDEWPQLGNPDDMADAENDEWPQLGDPDSMADGAEAEQASSKKEKYAAQQKEADQHAQELLDARREKEKTAQEAKEASDVTDAESAEKKKMNAKKTAYSQGQNEDPTPLPTYADKIENQNADGQNADPTPLPTYADPTPLPTYADPTPLPTFGTPLPTYADPTPLPTFADVADGTYQEGEHERGQDRQSDDAEEQQDDSDHPDHERGQSRESDDMTAEGEGVTADEMSKKSGDARRMDELEEEAEPISPDIEVLPSELTGKSARSLSWWAVLLIVIVSVMVITAIVVTIMRYHCDHEYHTIKAKVCGRGKAEYEPLKSTDEYETMPQFEPVVSSNHQTL